MAEGRLYSADNMDVLRGGYLRSESVDLVYLDPPFNSQRDYNIIYKERDETPSRAQIKAFEDSWHWDADARETYEDLVTPDAQKQGIPAALSTIMRALHDALPNRSDMFAYLVMMAPRLVELRRVLKPTGSLYLHCDPTASHYLKLLLDAVFGPTMFRSEIIWKRQTAHSDTKQGRKLHGRIHDTILFYTKGDEWTWNVMHIPYDESYLQSHYKSVDAEGRRFRLDNLTGPGGAAKGNPYYEVMGIKRYWRFSKDRMDGLIREGRIVQTKPGTVPQYKRYLDEMHGVSLQDLWTDLNPLNSQAKEALGYPTQKPLSLLDRIIAVSSNKGDVVLDPFCGCGTAIEAAHRLGREWIGIDITHLAIDVIRRRLAENFPGIKYRLFSIPRDLESARALAETSPYEFQFWAARKIGAFVLGSDPHAREGKRGADRGVDGLIRFRSGDDVAEAVVSVKGGHVNASHVRDLRGTIERRHAPIGILLTLQEPTRPMLEEAADAGFIRRGDEKFARIQIVTIEQVFEGKLPLLPGQKERAPAPGENLPLPGFERPAPPPPRGVLITVPEQGAEAPTPMIPAGERKPAKRAARVQERLTIPKKTNGNK
jgi:site-specific DNA-methyltransferase (adenine-specific)